MGERLVRALAALLRLPGDPPSLPHGDPREVRVFRAAPAFLTYRLVVTLAGAALLAGGTALLLGLLSFAVGAPGARLALRVLAGLSLGAGAVLGGGGALLVQVDYALRHYVVTDRALRIREGALTVRELTLSFENVQHVAVEQGPLERLLGIATVTVDTAGGGGGGAEAKAGSILGHRGRLRGVADAHAVRDLILRRLEGSAAGAGLGDDAAQGLSRAEVEALRAVREETRALAREVGAARPVARGEVP